MIIGQDKSFMPSYMTCLSKRLGVKIDTVNPLVISNHRLVTIYVFTFYTE